MKDVYIAPSKVHGKGVFSGEKIRKGERIQYIQGRKVKTTPEEERNVTRMANWYGLGRHVWLDPQQSAFRYLNHSCNPNCAIMGTKTLVALTAIEPDEELTVDYAITDPDPLWEMECSCGSRNCRKRIRAIYFVPKKVFDRHMPYVPRYFQRAFKRATTRS